MRQIKWWGSGAALLMFVAPLSAEGLRIYGLSAEGQSRAEAAVASASDAGAAWYNPALLTGFSGPSLSANVDNLNPTISFTPDSSGQKENNNEKHFFIPALYWAMPMREGKWAAGLAVNSPFGLSSDYSTASAFRYATTGGEINLINVNPSVAYRISPKLSVAGGLMYFKSEAEIRQQYPWFLVNPAFPDGSVRIEGSGDGWGANAALAWKPREGHTLGLTYRSQVVVKYDGKQASVTGPAAVLGPSQEFHTDVETTLRYPDMVAVGYAWDWSDKTMVEMGGNWTNWNDFGEARIDFAQNPLFLQDSTKPLHWKNGYGLRAGFTHECSERFSVSGGYAYDHSPRRESDFTPLVPDADHHVVSAGGQWKRGSYTVSLPLTLIFQGGPSRINSQQPGVQGTLDVFAYKIGLGVNYAFK